MKKTMEFLSIFRAKRPKLMVLGAILLFNIVFFILSALIISSLSVSGTEKMGFFEAAFCTVTMILDAGCIQFVVADIGTAGVAIVLVCLAVVLIGMVTFSGAVIGYVTNIISGFIENANRVHHPLHVSGHTVLLNWNNRASVIINELLYTRKREVVVVLVRDGKEAIEREVAERLAYTVRRDNRLARQEGRRGRLKNRVTVIVKQGEPFSGAQLRDICIEQAKSVILLGSGRRPDDVLVGDAGIVKELMQVCVMTDRGDDTDRTRIVVEAEDNRTWDLVQGIIRTRQLQGACHIVPMKINEILGRLLAQFALMPALHLVYRELFSNRGATFYALPTEQQDEDAFIRGYLAGHTCALPLTIMESGGRPHSYYIAAGEEDISARSDAAVGEYSVRLDPNFVLGRQNVIILGHNSRLEYIMEGFAAFYGEWGAQDPDILHVTIIDRHAHSLDCGRYSFATMVDADEIRSRQAVCRTLEKALADDGTDTNIIILSDDSLPPEELDANAFAGLICVQEVLERKKREDPLFDLDAVDMLVEIIDPRHVDIVRNYSVNNVVVSNRYTSKMITQAGEKDAINDIFTDILQYDEAGSGQFGFNSKEIYVKDVSAFFAELPGPCTAAQLVRAVYEASADPAIDPAHRCPAVVLGYCTPDGQAVLFSGDMTKIPVALTEKDRIVVFGNH